jgi:hypothetical protein
VQVNSKAVSFQFWRQLRLKASLRALARRLVKARVSSWGEIRGCTPDEIEEIRSAADGPRPKVYEYFLRTMEKGAGGFLKGTDIFYLERLRLSAAYKRKAANKRAFLQLARTLYELR